MQPVIEIQNLAKSYGTRKAVDDLTLTIGQGELFGFIGPNGAGKTTTIRMMAGLLEPDAGDILIAGQSVRHAPDQVKRAIGYMPDAFGIYPDLKTWEYLDFFAMCYQIPDRQRPQLIDSLLELVDLQHRREDAVDKLSRGMKQRLSLARALIHDPQVLILDEPASGLDPRARVEIRELLVELAGMGKTIFFSTHILADVAEICTQVGILEAGKLVAQGTLEALHLQLMPHRRVEITLLDQAAVAQELLTSLPGVLNVSQLDGSNDHSSPADVSLSPRRTHGTLAPRSRVAVEFQGDDQALSRVLAALIQHGIPVLYFHEDQRDLEELFLQATQGIVS